MDATTKECFWCGEEIKTAAKLCRYCGRDQVAPEEPKGEQVFYAGPALYPIGQLIADIVLLFLCVGFITLPLHFMQHQSRRYKLTSKRVEVHRGFANRTLEVVELYRVQDLRFTSQWGRGTIILETGDKSTPRVSMRIPNARVVFDKLHDAVHAARKEARVFVADAM